jgi:sensor histidine kinase YesM
MSRVRLTPWLFIFSTWTLIGLFFTTQAYFIYDRPERPLIWYKALIPNLAFCYMWALSTPVVQWLSRKYNFGRQRWPVFIGIHLLSAVIISVLQSPYYFLVRLVVFPDVPLSLTRPLELVYINLDRQLLIYSVILLLSHAFDYYQRYREREWKASQLEAQLAIAQLQALKMQLRPHFLFNALHSISTLIHDNVEAADTMIARLGDFLRLALEHTGEQKVPLREELESAKCYVDIEKIRFGDNLSLEFEIEPNTLDALVPSFLWQPVVENAIRHGLATLTTRGRITLRSKCVNGQLELQVQDNGTGLAKRDNNPIKEGIGLSNIRASLEQLYGGNYSFELVDAQEGGVLVTLTIPLELNGATSGNANTEYSPGNPYSRRNR